MFQKNVFAQGGRRGEGEARKPMGAEFWALGELRPTRLICPGLEQALDVPAKKRSAALPIVRKGKEWPKDIGSRSITLYLIPRRSPRTRSSLGRPSPPTAAGPSLEAFLSKLMRKGSLNASLRSSSIASNRPWPPTTAPPIKRRSPCSATRANATCASSKAWTENPLPSAASPIDRDVEARFKYSSAGTARTAPRSGLPSP